jgi:agmatine deiminase
MRKRIDCGKSTGKPVGVKQIIPYKAIALLVVLFLFSSCINNDSVDPSNPSDFYHFNKNRVVAEWEPAKGVIFVCPPVIPKELIIEFAKDTRLYPVIKNEEELAKALEWFVSWGIDTSRVHFIKLQESSSVPRDWGPPTLFSKEGQMKLADVQYLHSAPFTDLTCNDSLEIHWSSLNVDTLVQPLARKLGIDLIEVPITSTGGNVLVDGIGTAFSTCILLAENRYNGMSDEDFFSLSDSLLGYDNYHIISNFETYGIQHIDCLLKIIDEETLLVAQPPEDHELYHIYENIVKNEISRIKNIYGKPYQIKRIKSGRIIEEYLTAYTNSLILNNTVYVPLYGIETDSQALETWRSVMPGYTIKGFHYVIQDQPYIMDGFFDDYLEYGNVPGWAPDDALHCRTRAIWDENMVFISLNKISSQISVNQDAVLFASIRDYSNFGFDKKAIKLYWRNKGKESWNIETMKNNGTEYHWYGRIPAQEENTIIEYFVEALSKSGKSGKRPMTAPNGFYEFTYVSQK